MKFGDKVKYLREKWGMNQKELADRSAITQATISRIESGQVKELRSDTMKRLATALRVKVDYLVSESDEPRLDDILQTDDKALAILLKIWKVLPEQSKMHLLTMLISLLFTQHLDNTFVLKWPSGPRSQEPWFNSSLADEYKSLVKALGIDLREEKVSDITDETEKTPA
ncbi:MAG: helix-turn-helix transcriptional regulator [Armatimonadota bacterium]